MKPFLPGVQKRDFFLNSFFFIVFLLINCFSFQLHVNILCFVNSLNSFYDWTKLGLNFFGGDLDNLDL